MTLPGMTLTASAIMDFGGFPKRIHEVEHAQQCYRSLESDRASCFAAVKRSAGGSVNLRQFTAMYRALMRIVVGSDELDWLWMIKD